MLRRPLSIVSPAEAPYLARLLKDEPLPPAPPPERLATAALDHKVVGYLLEAHGRDRLELPTGLAKALRAQRAIEALQGAILRRELASVEPLVREACGAPPVLIKGPGVAQRLYPDPTLRPFADLDLVVPRDRLTDAAEGLGAELGYRPVKEPWPGYGQHIGHHIGVERFLGKQRLKVELHWRLADDPVADRLDHRRLLGAAEPLALAEGGNVLIPRLDDDLLVLAVHLVQEPAKRLVWINDLGLAGARASQQQWEEAFGTAAELGLGWVLERGLDYAERHLGFDRARPVRPSTPPPWGPLRVGERMDGWLSYQIGQLAIGGWAGRNGYLRLAARGRSAQLRSRRGGARGSAPQ